MSNANLSAEALNYFLALAADAPNWSGTPMIGGNVEQGEAQNGYLTACKKANLLVTFRDDGEAFVEFTEKGAALAEAHGINVYA